MYWLVNLESVLLVFPLFLVGTVFRYDPAIFGISIGWLLLVRYQCVDWMCCIDQLACNRNDIHVLDAPVSCRVSEAIVSSAWSDSLYTLAFLSDAVAC